MAYLINKTNGQLLVSILDNQADGPNINPGFNTSDLNLFGKNFAIFGELLNENFVKLLENFSNNTPPTTPIKGQLWFDTANAQNNKLKIYDGASFVEVSPITVSPGQPSVADVGDIWWDTQREQMFVYTGEIWALVGPQFSAQQGKSGAIPEPVWDLNGDQHMVIKFYSNDNLGAMYSYDPEFTSNVEILGFGSNVAPGFALNSNVAGQYQGTASNSLSLGGFSAAQYARKDIVETFASDIAIAAGDVTFSTTGSGNAVIRNTVNNASTEFRVLSNGVDVQSAYASGSTGRFKTDLTPVDNNDVTNRVYVNTLVASTAAPLASTVYVNAQINNLFQYANTAISVAVAPLASTAYVNNLVSTSVAPLAAQEFVESEFTNLRNYTDTLVTTAVAPLSTQQALQTVENDLTAYVDAKFLPGMIMMWFGSLLNMPPGWVLCDGNNGTPDLRNQFVVGAGSAYALAATGGSNSVALTQNQLPVHAHGATTVVAAATHAHTMTVNNSTSLLHNHPVTVNSADAVHAHALTINSQNVNHVHSGTTSNQSANHTHGFSGSSSTANLTGSFAVGGPNESTDGVFSKAGDTIRRPGLDFKSGSQHRINFNASHSHTFSGTTSAPSANHNHFVTTGGMSTNESHAHTGSAAAAAATHVHTATTSSVDLTHNHTGTTDPVSASHNHIVTVNNAGGGAAFDVRPPYTALFYIMKT